MFNLYDRVYHTPTGKVGTIVYIGSNPEVVIVEWDLGGCTGVSVDELEHSETTHNVSRN